MIKENTSMQDITIQPYQVWPRNKQNRDTNLNMLDASFLSVRPPPALHNSMMETSSMVQDAMWEGIKEKHGEVLDRIYVSLFWQAEARHASFEYTRVSWDWLPQSIQTPDESHSQRNGNTQDQGCSRVNLRWMKIYWSIKTIRRSNPWRNSWSISERKLWGWNQNVKVVFILRSRIRAEDRPVIREAFMRRARQEIFRGFCDRESERE